MPKKQTATRALTRADFVRLARSKPGPSAQDVFDHPEKYPELHAQFSRAWADIQRTLARFTAAARLLVPDWDDAHPDWHRLQLAITKATGAQLEPLNPKFLAGQPFPNILSTVHVAASMKAEQRDELLAALRTMTAATQRAAKAHEKYGSVPYQVLRALADHGAVSPETSLTRDYP